MKHPISQALNGADWPHSGLSKAHQGLFCHNMNFMYRLDVRDPAFKCILSAVDLKGIEDVGRKGEIEHELINWAERGEGFCPPSCSDSLTTQESVDLPE